MSIIKSPYMTKQREIKKQLRMPSKRAREMAGALGLKKQ